MKECYLLGRPGNCQSGNCLPGDCLPGRAHSLPGEKCYLPGKLTPGDLPAWESELLQERRVLSTGEAWELPAWDCLPRRVHSLQEKEALGKSCLSLLGKTEMPEGKH